MWECTVVDIDFIQSFSNLSSHELVEKLWPVFIPTLEICIIKNRHHETGDAKEHEQPLKGKSRHTLLLKPALQPIGLSRCRSIRSSELCECVFVYCHHVN